MQIEQKWNRWLDKTTSYKFYLPSNKSFCVPWNEKASLKHSWYNTAVQAIRECQHIPKFYQKFTEKYLCSDEGHFQHFFLPFTWGSKIFFTGNLSMAKLSEKHFSNFLDKKTIFEPSLSFSTMTTSMKNWKWFDCVIRERERRFKNSFFVQKIRKNAFH